MGKIINALKHPHTVALYLSRKGWLRWVPDETFLKFVYRINYGRKLELENPQRYTDKIQWLKLYDRRPEYVQMVDKYGVREYIAERIGEEYLVPVLGVWDRFDDIDFDALPDQFVLKCTHDSASVIVCTDKSALDLESAKKRLTRCLKNNGYDYGREWPYKNVPPRIIAEEYLVDESGYELKDYKFFCFDGEVKALFVAKDRQNKDEETKFDFFDADFNHLPFRNGHPTSDPPYYKPENFEKMKELAAKLSVGIPQVRVDFYNVNGKIYFGELTFFHWSGMRGFEPDEWDFTFGSWIKLPDKTE